MNEDIYTAFFEYIAEEERYYNEVCYVENGIKILAEYYLRTHDTYDIIQSWLEVSKETMSILKNEYGIKTIEEFLFFVKGYAYGLKEGRNER